MSIDTIYDFNYASPGAISREEYTDVGTDAFTLGTFPRAFAGGTDFEIWTAAVGGTQLTEGTDYVISQDNNKGDKFYSNQSGITLYSNLTILNVTYQTGSIYISYKAYGTYISAAAFNTLLAGIDPVGTIKPWHESASWIPGVLPDSFQRCDGSAITNADSAGVGYRTPLLNAGSISFSVVWVAGVATIAATDVSALLVGQAVSGGAIASGAYITDITGTTVTISDNAISATVTTTFTETNGGRYLRGAAASGVGSLDAMQRIIGYWDFGNYTPVGTGETFSGVLSLTDSVVINALASGGSVTRYNKLSFDNSAGGTYKTNGTGTGDGETKVLDMTVVWIIKVV